MIVMMMLMIMTMMMVILLMMVMEKMMIRRRQKIKNMLIKFSLMNSKNAGPTYSNALFYILYYKKLSVTPFQVYRLYICNWKQNVYVNSCIRLSNVCCC